MNEEGFIVSSRDRDIEFYFLALKNMMRNIKKINLDVVGKYDEGLFRRNLYMSFIDTLSICAYPDERKVGKRFVSFVENFSDWEEADRICVTQLWYYLRQNNNISDYYRLYEEVKTRWDELTSGNIYRPETEPHIDELRELGLDDEELSKYKYSALLWRYRNFLVHEFRMPGHGMNLSDDQSTPFVHSMLRDDDENISWELFFPEKFIICLATTCLEKLKDYCYRERINPYQIYKFGSYWYE